MIDYKCLIEIYRDGHEIHTDTIITIEEDIKIDDDFERSETIRDILLEKLKEEYDEDLELLEYAETVENVNLYRFEDKDVYFE